MNNTEPLITTAVITAIIAALITLLKAFGVPITEDQQNAINQFLVVLAPLIVAGIARVYVTPLSRPRDLDGETLSRPNEVPAIKELGALQVEAKKINEGMHP